MGEIFMKCEKTMYKVKGFTLIEMIVVIAIIGVLSAILIVSISNYVEEANNVADIQQAKDLCTLLEAEVALDPNVMIPTDNPWPGEENRGHGYVYIDKDEIRVSSDKIAEKLANNGYIKPEELNNYTLRGGRERSYSYTNNKCNIFCRSSKPWIRYQVNFDLDDNGQLKFSYSASRRHDYSPDAEASEDFAGRIGGQADGTRPMGNDR